MAAKNKYQKIIIPLLQRGLSMTEIRRRTGATYKTVRRYQEELEVRRASDGITKMRPGFWAEWMTEVNRIRALGGLGPLPMPEEGSKS